jgi:hypothetical protein
MDDRFEQLRDAEQRAVDALGAELGEYMELTADIFNFIADALSRLPDVRWGECSGSRKVVTTLLIRLGNDLRCASMLAIRGYPAQAAAVVATMYEVAYTVAFIGADESHAAAWSKHNDPTKLFKGDAFTLTRDGMAAVGVHDSDAVASQYRVYRQLCMAKHSNPLFEKLDPFVLTTSGITFTNGPQWSPPAVRAARFALEHAAELAIVALLTLVQEHVSGTTQQALAGRIAAFDARWKRLHAESVRLYPEGDPSPGKW